jgi:hypothetical protein
MVVSSSICSRKAAMLASLYGDHNFKSVYHNEGETP